jgi:hypothetical protein
MKITKHKNVKYIKNKRKVLWIKTAWQESYQSHYFKLICWNMRLWLQINPSSLLRLKLCEL